VRQFGGKGLRHALTIGGGVSSTHQRNRPIQQEPSVAEYGEDGGCIVQHGQQRRIAGFASKDHARAEPIEGVQFTRSIVRRRAGGG